MRTLPPSLAICAALLCYAALAQQSPPPKPPEGQSNGQEPGHHMPPPEALAACKTLTNGAACSMTTPRGTLTGTCGGPEDKPLACRPAHPPQGDGQGKPPPKPAN